MKTKINKLPNSEVEIEGELESSVFESYFAKALKILGEKVEIDGFRKGRAPENVLISKVGEMHVLEEMAELALAEHYPKILEEEKIDAIGRPEIFITKIARNNPLGFKIKTAVIPEIQIADYKKIAKDTISKIKPEEKNIEVTEEEIEQTIMDIRKSRAPKKHVAEPVEPHEHKEGEEHKHEEIKEELPEWNDEFVQSMGPFKDVADFREKLKENIKLEKENSLKEKTRLKIIEKVIDDSKMEIPELLIDSEVSKILYRMESDVAQMGLKFEDYLKHLNKTTEDLKKDFRADGEKKAKLALVLNKIAEVEKIVADEEALEKEINHILEHYKDADPERVRAHTDNVLTNEKVFQFLESQ
ncbi:MAG: trigger factor [Candidatus Paceibacterota bacterium]|jgi:trigger factor